MMPIPAEERNAPVSPPEAQHTALDRVSRFDFARLTVAGGIKRVKLRLKNDRSSAGPAESGKAAAFSAYGTPPLRPPEVPPVVVEVGE